jgi:nucleotide-binding universal stress UspA family protein/hemerythrin-like domain-containing protein
MYRHLLLPLDDSPLAVDTARKGVQLARSLGARVTFFHAQEDYGATSVGALQRVIAPAEFNEGVAGDARAILAKAEVVAREAGVAYDSLAVTSNRPYEAILDAADSHGCDLIFIASHGRRGIKGLMLGSQTQKVLHHATIPVLVSAIEANLPAGALIAPLAIIGDEHRSIAAVIHGLEFLVREARERRTPPPFGLLHAMLYYVREFPQKLHHPKEETYLFRKLRQRTSELDEVLGELERQHVEGDRCVDELAQSLARYEADPADGFDAFAAAVERFSSTQLDHMRLETKLILPAARRLLTDDDWTEIGRAFSENGDPRFSIDNDEEFRALFARILNLAPEQLVGAAGRT